MGQLAAFLRLAGAEPRADYAVVYIAEAHPTDGWLYPAVEHAIKQHTELDHRVAAATVLRAKLADLHAAAPGVAGVGVAPPPLYVDTMRNSASLSFGALPERLAIVVDDKVVFIGGKGPEEYSMTEAEVALAGLLA